MVKKYVMRMTDPLQIEEAKRYCEDNNIKYEFENKKNVFSYTDFYFTSKKSASRLLRFDHLPFLSLDDLKGLGMTSL
jgi:hypothetical protein